MSFLGALFGGGNDQAVKKFLPLVEKINGLESVVKDLSSEALKAKTLAFKERLGKGEPPEDILPEAFAAVREASKRTLGERHFDVQLIGGAILHQGKIAEMRTGEGKTLVATLPTYLNALSGLGVHVVTVNDYLSRRDAVWMGQVYDALGLSVGVITSDGSYLYDSKHTELDTERDIVGSFRVVYQFLRPASRREAYAADITYGTNNEFGFDYLRDNLEYEPKNLRQRGYNYAVVDEIDSILIDEARTPLIISAPTTDSENLYATFAGIVRDFEENKEYTVDEKFKNVILTPEGITKAEQKLGIENIYTDRGIKSVHHLETAVRAKSLYKRDKEYVVRDGQVVIVDEFTGRLQPGRRWSEGLHQAIEAKEGVPVQKESRTFASITFQNYFRLYKKLSGMTGTALTSKEEFFKVYRLDTIAVPTNKQSQRKDHGDLILQSEAGKFKAVAKRVKELNSKGQPVLIGTVSIEKNEVLSAYLGSEGVKHEVLNAKNHEREGEIIAQAGKKGAVTIATNMAGRGVDIKLGGNPATKEEYEAVKNVGGLFVLGTERHEARRIDNQLRGRSGRQGDRGETQFFVSLEDSLMRIFAKDIIKKMMGRMGIKEDEAIENRLITRSLETAQTKIEGLHFDSRKHVLEYDDVMNHQRRIVYERRRNIVNGGKPEVDAYLETILENDAEARSAIEKKKADMGEDFYGVVRRLILQTIDMFWVDHLEMMEYLRGSVNLRAYGQRDPLVEYKREGLRLFKEMQASIAHEILTMIPNLMTGAFAKEAKELEDVHKKAKLIIASTSSAHSPKNPSSALPLGQKEPGRNDPCFCGSGKKYKKCHGQ
ncbi:MAG: preprotein translocase subunit SecA [Candidatus Taylorbacteria bacterium RIFCSPHIGHO2_01_FULL_45_63]|uniref:Protein translocase subunit SecA n=1 Tax=Candidatus Taylorbacteria bacterium RIFCSPHIGHO2_02_FULL_45_35 TaxID=1802311 RepID=A0A1G2MVB0_9BACT|nr:MAG: preprotein translocase subunit SecA [Candidatus Taylorbacteria bacterium RIFCSPHIGHO2_01_FULL_45_63]OHA27793.1 MAG: preprotein translocase subunit SecA [Candidatus Taylorbacteria bacterium RIFCSPHIGHO2_02_FULL_45_35]OHA34098.1 MAG: preprotein translocase subunit SecA [Candidatus Taylorbacteria bacterium RIFCSPLOWO2_01_FULL_45_34b]